MNAKRRRESLWVSLLSILTLTVQAQTQTGRGRITDTQSGAGVPLATVQVLDEPTIGATADSTGTYRLSQVPLGRHTLKITSVGYGDQVIPDVLFTAGKETSLDVPMTERVQTAQEVQVYAQRPLDAIDKTLAVTGAHVFDMEQTRRFAGNRNDPSRMAMNMAGVVGNNDSRNDIVIRGNSPTGLLWRVEGIDIPNPNHFGAMGNTGGPVPILNSNVIDRSVFLTGAFPAEYGNAVSGVFDIRLRNGNPDKREYTVQAGFNGWELGAEGPFSKGSQASYLAHYRYSFLQLFQALGINLGTGSALPQYQDAVFKVRLPLGKAGEIAVFGMGGTSRITFEDEPVTNTLYPQGGEYSTYNTKMGVVGLTHTYSFGPGTSLRTTLAATGNSVQAVTDSITSDRRHYAQYGDGSSQYKYTVHSQFNRKISAKSRFGAGVILSYLGVNYADSTRETGQFHYLRHTTGQTGLVQTYGFWQGRPSDRWVLNAGVYHQWLALTQQHSVEPRLSARYQLNQKQSLSLSVGRHSQVGPLQVFFNQQDQPDGTETMPNQHLGFVFSNQAVLGYTRWLGKQTSLTVEAYYQALQNVPVSPTSPSYSLLNTGTDFLTPSATGLTNGGSGCNYGLELTLERTFSRNYYVMATVSAFDSRYRGSDGVLRNTLFNNQWAGNFLTGGEWKISRKTTLVADLRVAVAGGKRYTPADLSASQQTGTLVEQTNQAFEGQFPAYGRLDGKLTLRVNGKHAMREWYFDLNNLTNRRNIYSQYYSPSTGQVRYSYQLGRYPVFGYRILF
ncbi:TonB-dependent receptor [Spirosoma validum]|uniref:TonB-dependent receptor n=1 Tax=Spirosoma validum TaxID=2771355 RepID=A0A927B2A8_9BACT|nr:TonB-dependent receptor [Spirosoma validum]MBD2754064.1 TonB-dependent receptor [Spirosoma validum]